MAARPLTHRERNRLASRAKGNGAALAFAGTATIKASELVPADQSAERQKEIHLHVYDGAPMLQMAFEHPVILDLAGYTPGPNTPILYDHRRDLEHTLGQSRSIEVKDGHLYASGPFLGCSETANEVLRLATNGFVFQASINGRADFADTDFVAPGQPVTVNGRNWTGPLYVARKPILQEFSFVLIGAAANTAALIARQTPPQAAPSHARRPAASLSAKGSAMNPTFEDWLLSIGFPDPTALDEIQTVNMKQLYAQLFPDAKPAVDATAAGDGTQAGAAAGTQAAATTQASAPPPNLSGAANQGNALAILGAQVGNILAACHAAGNPTIAVQGHQVPISAHALQQGWNMDRVNLEIVRQARPSGPNIITSSNAPNAAVLEASMCLSAGLPEKACGRWFDEKVMNQAVTAENRNYSLVSLAHTVLQAAGVHVRPGYSDWQIMRKVREAERILSAAGSTVSLPGILGNVANKALVNAYQSVEVVWPKIAAVRNHSDFKSTYRYRLDSTGAMKKVGPDGMLQSAGLSEGSFTNKLETYGCMLHLNRQMWINDDLGAFTALPVMLGRMATTRLEEAVFVLLLTNAGSFFHANNANLLTGAGSALSIDAITDAEGSFKNRVDSNAKPVLARPASLLVGTTLKAPADVLHTSRTVNETTTANKPKGIDNPHAGKYPPVDSPYINNTAIKDQDGAAIPNQSSTKWFMFADPNILAAIGVAFLNGQQLPTLESEDQSFEVLGYSWRIYHDFGVAFEDPAGALQNNGV